MSIKEKAQSELDAELQADKVKFAKRALQGIRGNESNIKMLQEENAELQKLIDAIEIVKDRSELTNFQSTVSLRAMRGIDRD